MPTATYEGIYLMAGKVAKERFCVDSAVRGFHIYKELRDYLVSHSQAN